MAADASTPAVLARVEERLHALGMSANAAGRAAGAAHLIPNLKKGSAASLDSLVKLAAVLETTPAYLAFGVEAADDMPTNVVRLPNFPPIATVPIIGEVAAGRWLAVDDAIDESPYDGIAVPPDPAHPIEHQFAAISKGTSINRVAPDGFILGCVDVARARIKPKDGDLVVVEQSRDGGHTRERTAKRYHRTDEGVELWPDSDDPRWTTPITIRRNAEDESTTITVLGIVTWVHRPLDLSERHRRGE